MALGLPSLLTCQLPDALCQLPADITTVSTCQHLPPLFNLGNALL